MIRQIPFKRPLVLSIVAAVLKDRADLVTENFALRHQLSCFIHRGLRPFTVAERLRRKMDWQFTKGMPGPRDRAGNSSSRGRRNAHQVI